MANANVYFVRVNGTKVAVGDFNGRVMTVSKDKQYVFGKMTKKFTGVTVPEGTSLTLASLNGCVGALLDAINNKYGLIKINMTNEAVALCKHLQNIASKPFTETESANYIPASFGRIINNDTSRKICGYIVSQLRTIKQNNKNSTVVFCPQNQWYMSRIWGQMPKISELKKCYVQVVNGGGLTVLPFTKLNGGICNWQVKHVDRDMLPVGKYDIMAIPYGSKTKAVNAKSTGRPYEWFIVNSSIMGQGKNCIDALDKVIGLEKKQYSNAVLEQEVYNQQTESFAGLMV